MTNNLKSSKAETDTPESWVTPERIFWGMLLFTTLVIVGYLGHFFWGWFGGQHYTPSKDPGDWGAFGDFVGGLVNPLIGLAGLYMLVTTLRQNQRVIEQAEDSLQKMQTALDQSQHALDVQKVELELTRKELEGSREAQQHLARTNADNLNLNIAVNRIDRLLTAEKAYTEQLNWIFDRKIKGPIFLDLGNGYVTFPPSQLESIIQNWQKTGQNPIALSNNALEELTLLFEVAYHTLYERNKVLQDLISSYATIGLDATFLKAGRIELLGEMLKMAIHNYDRAYVKNDFATYIFQDNIIDKNKNISHFVDQHNALMKWLDNNGNK